MHNICTTVSPRSEPKIDILFNNGQTNYHQKNVSEHSISNWPTKIVCFPYRVETTCVSVMCAPDRHIRFTTRSKQTGFLGRPLTRVPCTPFPADITRRPSDCQLFVGRVSFGTISFRKPLKKKKNKCTRIGR